MSNDAAYPATEISEDHESWITLMMGLAAAKEKPELQQDLEARIPPEVLQAAKECSSYTDFRQRLTQIQQEAIPNA